MTDLTPEEEKAIRSLKRALKNWPSSLELHSESGRLNIMKSGWRSEATTTEDREKMTLDFIPGIEIDGGNW